MGCMDTSRLNIYPLNEVNLKALLDYYFPNLPEGNISQLLIEIKGTGINLSDLEFAAQRILPFISFISERLKCPLTQTNALDYAAEIFLLPENIYSNLTPEREGIIRAVKSKIGMHQTYDQLSPVINNIFFYSNWN